MDHRLWAPSRSVVRGLGRSVVVTLLVLLSGLGVGGTAAGSPVSGGWSAAVGGPIAGQVRLTLVAPGASASTPAPGSVNVTVDGVRQPSRLEPLLSDRLALGLVVDGSEAGRAALPAGVSGATDLLIAIRPAHSGLVVDQGPPVLVVGMQPASSVTLAALSSVSTAGERQTSAALELAVAQLPTTPDEPRLLVLYTAAPDAGGPSAADLAGRLNAAGVVLAVVHTTAEGEPVSRYWSDVATDTGGLAVSSAPTGVIAAFVHLQTNLRDRYLLTFPAPSVLPATAQVRGDTPTGPFTVDAVLPSVQSASGGPGWWPLVVSALTLIAVTLGLFAHRRLPRGLPSGSTRSVGRHRRG